MPVRVDARVRIWLLALPGILAEGQKNGTKRALNRVALAAKAKREIAVVGGQKLSFYVNFSGHHELRLICQRLMNWEREI